MGRASKLAAYIDIHKSVDVTRGCSRRTPQICHRGGGAADWSDPRKSRCYRKV